MADIICRWRNPSPETIVELVSWLPKNKMSSKEFREYVETEHEGFFHTPYQLACQLALYYEGQDGYIPRFSRDITVQEAREYLEFWITKYYAPNPFTKSLKTLTVPVRLVEALVKYLEEHGNNIDLKDTLTDIYKDPMGNLDIITNTLNQYSKVIQISNGKVSLAENYKELMGATPNIKDKKGFFFFFFDNEDEGKRNIKETIQKIYYGCPGTGKSYKVKEETEGVDGKHTIYFDENDTIVHDINAVEDKSKLTSNIFRTTFHPDYDYSTFVGSYKPVMNPVLDEEGNDTGKEDLAYEFVPQVFTNAYVRAWKSLNDETLLDHEKHVYLIIEEINRGNCAQIFGDLFQLLDRRKDGRSEYFIVPDAELRKYLAKQGLESNKLILPENLHILATMNTSDQSLFPMDSAFKRRWAMEYIPVNLEHEIAKDFTFKVNGVEYSWVKFLAKVNPLIRKATDSEDKQMGEFFIKGNITEEDFKNKVMFYIWNDVCKDLYSASRISPLYFMRSEAGEDPKHVFTFAELFGAGRYDKEEDKHTSPTELLECFVTKQLELKGI